MGLAGRSDLNHWPYYLIITNQIKTHQFVAHANTRIINLLTFLVHFPYNQIMTMINGCSH